MNKIKSILTLGALAAVASMSTGCYTEARVREGVVYEPAGAPRYYYHPHNYYERGHRYEHDRYYYNRGPEFDLRIRP